MKMWMFYLIVGIVLLLSPLWTPTDTTDVSIWKRSGMALRIDNLTGCHYLETTGLFGFSTSVTPRLDESGKQICTGQE